MARKVLFHLVTLDSDVESIILVNKILSFNAIRFCHY